MLALKTLSLSKKPDFCSVFFLYLTMIELNEVELKNRLKTKVNAGEITMNLAKVVLNAIVNAVQCANARGQAREEFYPILFASTDSNINQIKTGIILKNPQHAKDFNNHSFYYFDLAGNIGRWNPGS